MITASHSIGRRPGAREGYVGRVRDVLFEDDSLRVRWLVVRPAALRHVAGHAPQPVRLLLKRSSILSL